jgi:hypothetical protein
MRWRGRSNGEEITRGKISSMPLVHAAP